MSDSGRGPGDAMLLAIPVDAFVHRLLTGLFAH